MNAPMRYTSAERRKLYGTQQWKRLRKAAVERDGWRCKVCGKAGRLEVHHIRSPFYGGPMWDIENLRTVCRPCHWKAHHADRKRQGFESMSAPRRAWWEFINDAGATDRN